MRWSVALVAGVALGLMVPLVGCDRGPARDGDHGAVPSDQPNVLLISIDTLRADHLHCYGYARATSPNIDRVAREGVLFENHISSTSWTLPAHAAMFTSLSDSVHGCTDTDCKLSAGLTTLAERFADAGFETAGFFSGPYLHPAFGLGQGFATYKDCTSYAPVLDQSPATRWAMDVDVMRRSHEDITSPRVFRAVSEWLARKGGSRFFLFVHLWDVHYDFIPPAPYDTKFDPDYTGSFDGRNFFFDKRINASLPKRDLEHIIALYDGEIAWTDHHVGLILDALRKMGKLDNTIVAITADHGTEFFEHGWKGHRTTLFDEVLHIPLIIRWPGKLPAGRRVAHQTRMVDLGPTLLELAGLAPPRDVMGHSLVGLARGGRLDFDNTAVSELFSVGRRLRTIRTERWKLFDDMVHERHLYVNLTDDPHEQRLLTDLDTPAGRMLERRYANITRRLEAFRARMGSDGERSTIPPEVMQRLKGLGYVGETHP